MFSSTRTTFTVVVIVAVVVLVALLAITVPLVVILTGNNKDASNTPSSSSYREDSSRHEAAFSHVFVDTVDDAGVVGNSSSSNSSKPRVLECPPVVNDDDNGDDDDDDGITNPTALVFSTSFIASTGSIRLSLRKTREVGFLCTLVDIKNTTTTTTTTTKTTSSSSSTDEDGNLELKPVARSYDGHDWERYAGPYSTTVSINCEDGDGDGSDDICIVTVPPPRPGRMYVLKSYHESFTPSSLYTQPEAVVTRFLARTTFGPTKTEISNFMDAGTINDKSVAAAQQSSWVATQMDATQTPITSHRAFWRYRVTHWQSECTQNVPTLHTNNPCAKGARYRKFAFTSKDNDRSLIMETTANTSSTSNASLGATTRNMFVPSKVVLRVDGSIRTVVDGPVLLPELGNIELEDGTYPICSIEEGEPAESVNGPFGLIVPEKGCMAVRFGAQRLANPPVHFDDQNLPDHPILMAPSHDGTSGTTAVPVLTKFFNGKTEMLELTVDIVDTNSAIDDACPGLVGAPERVTVLKTPVYKSDGVTVEYYDYWLHTTSMSLLQNTLDNPLPDGGAAFVRANADAPHRRMHTSCSSAPRSFLHDYEDSNETSCRYSRSGGCSRFTSDAENDGDQDGVVVCGSPFEIATHHTMQSGPLYRGGFAMFTPNNVTTTNFEMLEQRQTVWFETALRAPDQLRQRVAWAFAQLLVVSSNNVQERFHTESFLTFYDIFVRNAFGNYFDILKEVTYSFLMSSMLTYLDVRSTASVWEESGEIQFADENYAREIQQLFTVGLFQLSNDGTIQRDAEAVAINTYTNAEISEYAKVFTGFKTNKARGNIETSNTYFNVVDPLRIDIVDRDQFPKLGLENTYVGDGYPLCADLGPQPFLKKGAMFRLLGSRKRPQLLHEAAARIGGVELERLILDSGSGLVSKLCRSGRSNEDDSPCSPAVTVVLDEDVDCTGLECELQDLRSFSFEVDGDTWFEYVRDPCVHFSFFASAKTVKQRYPQNTGMCGDPSTLAASVVCCDSSSTKHGMREEHFAGERFSFSSAVERCKTAGRDICIDPFPHHIDCQNIGGCHNERFRYWSSAECSQFVKISREGLVTILHQPEYEEILPHPKLNGTSPNAFRVEWISTDTLDELLDDFELKCEELGCNLVDEENCKCVLKSVVQEVIYQNVFDLISVADVLSTAKTGSPPQSGESERIDLADGTLMKHPSGDEFSATTVFEIVDMNGQINFRKNSRSVVRVGAAGRLVFRNPVSFHLLPDPTLRDAQYETDAALEHLFFHVNMAPFLASHLAKRFGNSNPSPRLIDNVATAFRTGNHDTDGRSFGSGKYGCLAATIAALILDREMSMDMDPVSGSLEEPLLKLVKVLRSLEYQADDKSPLLRTRLGVSLLGLIGQQPFSSPSVFSFFLPDYRSSGRVKQAELTSPESKILNEPTSIQLTNILLSYLKYGLADCYGGVGSGDKCSIGFPNDGSSAYDPSKYDLISPKDVVDDLAVLITGGRLSDKTRDFIKDKYERKSNATGSHLEALIDAEQLLVTTPEFHTNGLAQTTGRARKVAELEPATDISYKAVVFVSLPGGCDSFNVLVPESCSGTDEDGVTLDVQYKQQRGVLALNDDELKVTIDASGQDQPCERFALHPDLTALKELYDSGELAFLANTGVINRPGLTRRNYAKITRTPINAHNSMQDETAKLDPFDINLGTGILGRAKTRLSERGHVVNSISIATSSLTVEPDPTAVIGQEGGVTPFALRPDSEQGFDIEKYAEQLNGEMDGFGSIFGDLWSSRFHRAIDSGRKFEQYFETPQLNETIWDRKANFVDLPSWNKWRRLAELIQTRHLRHVDRDLFSVQISNTVQWDHHSNMKGALRAQLRPLNNGIKEFAEQLKQDGVFENVVLVVTSDFGRRLIPNSNNGTEHGWGGNYFILGGSVKGGKIHGKYPSNLQPSSLLNNGRGLLLPTTSWDSVWHGIFQWLGLDQAVDLDYCLPNAANTANAVVDAGDFPLMTADDLFHAQ